SGLRPRLPYHSQSPAANMPETSLWFQCAVAALNRIAQAGASMTEGSRGSIFRLSRDASLALRNEYDTDQACLAHRPASSAIASILQPVTSLEDPPHHDHAGDQERQRHADAERRADV